MKLSINACNGWMNRFAQNSLKKSSVCRRLFSLIAIMAMKIGISTIIRAKDRARNT